MDAWPSSNWICSRSPPDSRHNLAQVLLVFMGSKFISESRLPCVLRHDMPDHSLAQRHRVFSGYFRRRTCRNSGPSDKPAAAEHAVRSDIHEQFARHFTDKPTYRSQPHRSSHPPIRELGRGQVWMSISWGNRIELSPSGRRPLRDLTQHSLNADEVLPRRDAHLAAAEAAPFAVQMPATTTVIESPQSGWRAARRTSRGGAIGRWWSAGSLRPGCSRRRTSAKSMAIEICGRWPRSCAVDL